MEQSQGSFASILQTAWELTQSVRDETGVCVELRLTTLGLTALSGDFLCSRMATVAWRELAEAKDLPGLLTRAVRDVADRPRPHLTAVTRERAAPNAQALESTSPRAPARARQTAGGRQGTGRAKATKRSRKQAQI
jgi:hypothetical protein